MNKCGIIEDLLPAYISGLCTDDTRALVDEHIGECADCRDKLMDARQRVALRLREKDAKIVNVFKSMKRKILIRNTLVAAVSAIIVAVLALFVGIKAIDYKPIAYFDGLARVEVSYADYHKSDENIAIVVSDPGKNPEITGKIPVLDIRSSKAYYFSNSAARTLVRGGETVNVQYVCFYENVVSKSNLRKDDSQIVLRHVYPELIGDTPVRTEVYYLEDLDAARKSGLSDNEFDEYRHKGALLWSGVIG